jgi:hypothetical protein
MKAEEEKLVSTTTTLADDQGLTKE